MPLRGEVELAGFLLGEQAARLRIARGDTAGAMDILGTAVAAARALVAQSDPDAPGWLAIFAEKLGGLMLANGRGPEGAALLREVAESIDLDHKARALALGHLAALAVGEGDLALADRYREMGVGIAERLGDTELAERLGALFTSDRSGPRRTKGDIEDVG